MENRELEMMNDITELESLEEVVVESSDSESDSMENSSHDTDYSFDNRYLSEDIEFQDEIDDVYNLDHAHCLTEKVDNKYYIGSYWPGGKDMFLLSSSISPSTYFKINHTLCSNYLYEYSMSRNTIKSTEILKVKIIKIHGWDFCSVIVKTFWLKIIQRKWKKIYKERMRIVKNRKKLESLYFREISGKFPNTCLHLPTLQGLLAY